MALQTTVEESRKSRLLLLLCLSGVMVILAALYFFVRPAYIIPKPANNSGIEKFSFERDYKNGESLSFSMRASDGMARVILYDSSLGGKREKSFPAEKLIELQTFLAEQDIIALDQYYERAPYIGHRDSFSLSVQYADDQDIKASGVTMLPSNIEAVTAALKGYFLGLFAPDDSI